MDGGGDVGLFGDRARAAAGVRAVSGRPEQRSVAAADVFSGSDNILVFIDFFDRLFLQIYL